MVKEASDYKQVIQGLLWKVLILVVLFSPLINAQKIKDLPKVNKYSVYTDSLRILFDRHDSTKTTETRYFKYGMYRWTNGSYEFNPRLYYQATNPLLDTTITSIDSMDIWYWSGIPKYYSAKDSAFYEIDSLNGTHIDPTGVYTRNMNANRTTSDTTYVNDLYVSGTLNVSTGAQVLGINYTWKQATDPALTADSIYVYPSQLWYDTDNLATYRRNATDDGWDLIIPGLWQAPTGSGLYLTDTHMGYYSGGSFQTYIQNNGYFYFNGDANNYIKWLGDTLKIKGVITALNPQDFPKGATVYRQNGAPTQGAYPDTVLVAGDIWLKANNGDEPHSWDGSAWIRTYTTISGGDIVTGTIAVNKLIVGTLTGYTLETAGNDTARVRINGSNNRIEWVNNSNVVIGSLYPSGTNVVTLTGNIANQDTITGGVIRTASSGARAELTGASNDLRFWSTTNAVIGSIGSGADILHIDGSGLLLTGSVTSDITLQTFTAAGFYGDINLTSSRNIEATGSGSFTWNGAAIVTGTPWTSMGYLTSLPSHGNEAHTSTFLTSSDESWRATDVTAIGTSLTNTGGTLSVTGYNNSDWDSAWDWVETYSANAVLTSGSYSNPTWITQLAETKIHTGSGGNAPAYFDGSGNLALGSVSSPITITAGAIGILTASTSQSGAISSTDWNTFNGKATASFGSTDASTVYVAPSSGASATTLLTYVPITINGTTYNVLLKP